MGLTSVYAKLAACAPSPEQVAEYKRRRQQTLSRKELQALADRKAARRNHRQAAIAAGKPVATYRRYPEREPGRVTVLSRGVEP